MGAWPVYYVWPMPSHSIFESSDNWLNTHKADWRWPIIILLIGRDGQSRGQRALAVFYSSDLDTAVHTGICETELLVVFHNIRSPRAWWRHDMETFLALLAFCERVGEQATGLDA